MLLQYKESGLRGLCQPTRSCLPACIGIHMMLVWVFARSDLSPWVFVSYEFIPSIGGLWHCELNIPPFRLCTLIACLSAKAKLACMMDAQYVRLGDLDLQFNI